MKLQPARGVILRIQKEFAAYSAQARSTRLTLRGSIVHYERVWENGTGKLWEQVTGLA